MMEAQVFDHTYPEKALDKRLKKLEKKVLPGQDNSQLGLFQRTSKLWIALHPADKNNMDNFASDSNSNANGNSTASQNNVANAPNSNVKHTSWLHKLAKEISAATMSPGYSGYSNFSGGGYGYPTYPTPGSFYVPQSSYYNGYGGSRFVGGSFGPGAGPAGLPVGFW